jgi:uncharacterized glyoxalase superfamily protein PhnB
MQFSAPVPILRIFDEEKARAFYIGFLGFSVDWEHRFEPGTPIYMQIRLGEAVLHLSEHHGDATPGSGIRIKCEDVDAYCALLNGKRYKYGRPGAQDMTWGTRDTTIPDPFGNRITFWSEKRGGASQ